jgi:hypothetical protein
MLKRGLVLVMSLAFVSSAFAGATVDLVATDLGNSPCNGIDGCAFTPAPGQFNGGETILVHVMVTPSQTIRLRGAQVDHRASSPELQLGTDIDSVNQPLDTIPNFWFDYSSILLAGTLPLGFYPAGGLGTFGPTTGSYTDFSNLDAGSPPLPFPPATTYSQSSDIGGMLQFDAGVATRLGGIVVTLPTEPGQYTVDLLNAPAGEEPSVNNGMVFDFGFGINPGDDVTKWASAPQGTRGGNPDLLISYERGPLTLTVIPEPATLVLLGLGGIAALRRRRS